MLYQVQFIRDWDNIPRGSIVLLPEFEAISAVWSGYAVYYVT